eukprot:COSAG03_NODE_6770_length_1008_cov_1.182618_2_plen_76_part_01
MRDHQIMKFSQLWCIYVARLNKPEANARDEDPEVAQVPYRAEALLNSVCIAHGRGAGGPATFWHSAGPQPVRDQAP